MIARQYPDSTFEQIVYKHLDPILHRDRRGHWTQTIYDPLRRVVAIQDALNRVTRFDWCSCGALGGIIDPMGRVTSWITDYRRQPIAGVMPTFRLARVAGRGSFLEFKALATKAGCFVSYIHPNVSTHGPPTSSAVQVNLGMIQAESGSALT